MSKKIKVIKQAIPKEFFEPIVFKGAPMPSLLSMGSTSKIKKVTRTSAEEIRKELNLKFDKKLNRLIKYTGFDIRHPGFWQKFAMFLIQNFVPGFEIKQAAKEGPKTKWDHQTLLYLYLEVRERRKAKGGSAMQVCSHMAKQSPWNEILKNYKSAGSGDSLYRQYQKAKQSELVMPIDLIVRANLDNPKLDNILNDLLVSYRVQKVRK